MEGKGYSKHVSKSNQLNKITSNSGQGDVIEHDWMECSDVCHILSFLLSSLGLMFFPCQYNIAIVTYYALAGLNFGLWIVGGGFGALDLL